MSISPRTLSGEEIMQAFVAGTISVHEEMKGWVESIGCLGTKSEMLRHVCDLGAK